MFSHIMLGANDIEASKKFYNAILGVLGQGEAVQDPKGRYFWVTEKGILAITSPINGKSATGANGGTVGFAAASTDQVDAWHAKGLANGGTTCEDPPGPRHSGMYAAYLRDPSGNKLCAVHRS